ncbi:MAG: ATP-binding cassette domain-containing protein [Ilumatobacteraceae bacterium]
MIEIRELTKRFGRIVAVDGLSFDVHPGRVTGFLGPNGSGKSTTMRCMVGLDLPERGTTRFDGKAYESIRQPLFEIGALFDAGYVHPARSARNHLRWLAATHGMPATRIDEVLGLVGLTDVAGRKVKGYSLGMRQRLGLAGVLLGDPHTVILDEPANGLDPEGIRWIRDVLVHLARGGRTVLVSSHLLSEIALIADDLVVVGRGRLIEQGPVSGFIDRYSTRWVRVRTPRPAAFAEHVTRAGGQLRPIAPDGMDVHGLAIERIGALAAQVGAVLHELSPQTESLEDAFLRATAAEQEYRAVPAPGGPR